MKPITTNIQYINMTELYQTLQQQKNSIVDIAKHYHAVNVRVFGSVVRGEDNENSDIDLLVDFLPGATLIDHVGLIQTLSAKLGRKVDVVSSVGWVEQREIHHNKITNH